jgi:hypothetical protein
VREWGRGGATFRTGISWTGRGLAYHAVKATGDRWDPHEHPRDARGRFVRKNAHVRLFGGGTGRVTGFDSRSRRFVVRRDSDGHTVKMLPAHITVIDDDKPHAPHAGTPKPTGTATEVLPPGPGPKTTVQGVSAIKPDLTTSYRNVIGEYDFEQPWNPPVLREAAWNVRNKKPLNAAQADALGDALRDQKASATPARQRVLDRISTRMDTVSQALTGIHPQNIPAHTTAKKIKPGEAKPGDVIALPGRGGAADTRLVLSNKEFYGQQKMVLASKDGSKEERLVHLQSDMFRLGDDATPGDSGKTGDTAPTGPKAQDMGRPKGAVPAALYDGPGGAGAVDGTQRWYDVLAESGMKNTPLIPVAGLTIQGHTIHDGVAQRRNGRSFLAERRLGETDDEMADRIDRAAKTLDQVLSVLPPGYDTAPVLRGMALVEGLNPADKHWEKKYGISGFTSGATGGMGGITVWAGNDPDPAVIAHEFGHNVDTHLHGNGSFFSDQKTPVLTGQIGTWEEAIAGDLKSSGFYADGRFKETRPGTGHKITPGEKGPTSYGGSSTHEDFAESVRLWMKDRREGKIGFDPKSVPAGGSFGDDIRFADLYPARARILDVAFGASPVPETDAQKKRKAELAAEFDKLLTDNDGNIMLGNGTDGGAADEAAAFGRGLVIEDVEGQWVEALSRWAKTQEEKAAAEKAAAALKAKQEKQQKAAEAKVRTAKEAVNAGLMDTADASTLTAKVNAYRNQLHETISLEELDERVAAYEAELVAAHFGLTTDFQQLQSQTWLSSRLEPGIKEAQRRKAKAFLEKAGTTVHPRAAPQAGKAEQAKANIAAELAARLNNPDDWELFRQYRRDMKETVPLPFDEIGEDGRHTLLADEASERVRAWAYTAGDSKVESVLMQQAVKEEFGLDGPTAPNIDQEVFDNWMASKWPARGAWYRRVARHQYEHTQDELEAAGITHVGLYRGMHFHASAKPDWLFEGTGPADLSPVNAWTSLKSVSKLTYFGSPGTGSGWLLEGTVPRELVLGTARTGFGCLHEWEYVVMNNPGDLKMYRI